MSWPLFDLIRMLPQKLRHEWMSRVIAKNLATQIRVLREARGLTQKQLGEKCGMTQSGIARLETLYGAGHCSVNTLVRIAAALDVALQVRFCSWGEWINIYITPNGAFVDDGLGPSKLSVKSFAEDMAALGHLEEGKP